VKDSLEGGPRTIRFDCRFLDASGRELVEIDNLVLHLMEGQTRSAAVEPTTPNVTLQIESPGVLETLATVAAPRRAPEAGEVEIQVAAAGLNFRDVLRALGMLSAEHDAGSGVVGFGAECAGKVVRIGAGVSDIAVGDDVLAFATRSFSRFVTTSALAVARIPVGLGFVEAASIPMVFLTAYHALHGLARLRKGERVLIHAAAGGVGLAAVQIALMKGADVIGTVGSAEKREYLHSLGVTQVTTSRSLDFVDDVKRFTGGAGVDVVLNALTGEFIPASLGLLKSGGRFIEIGARDIYQNAMIGLRPFANNLTFSAFDLGQVAAADPPYLRQMLSEILADFERGRLQVLPIDRHPIAEAAAAFGHMAAARHIGKVVVSVAEMARNVNAGPAAARTAVSASGRDLSHGILPAEGVDALERALAAAAPHLIVTTRRVQAFMGASAPGSAAPVAKARKLHPRPALPTRYTAPETPEEKAIELLWRELLGIDSIGVNDNFFELGGDSLLGVQLISTIKARHAAQAGNIRPADLYDSPTIKELARKLAGTTEDAAGDRDQKDRVEARRERRERRRTRAGQGTE
jgi:NADPH:quinone reductase-like Zn-dependent oxidoreductase